MSQYTKLDAIIEDRRVNAVLSWVLTLFLLLVVVESLLGGDWLWGGFAGTVAVIILIPTAIHRDLSVMLPWEVVLLALLPVIGRAM
ncbi:MAG: hypothetical protein SV377_00330, partial [Halobacteria archaeon]|nr:hypothetical protein [Halobacteria archaeon]